MYINKPTDPGTLSSRHPLHQDLWYFPLTNLDRVVACWTALQPITRYNGGLSVIPGSHKNIQTGKVLVHDYPKWHGPTNHLYVGIPHDIYKKVVGKRIHLKMEPGDCVFFHGLTIHGSSANLSNKFRRSLCCHFLNSKLCGYQPFIRYDQVNYGKMISGAKMGKKKGKSKFLQEQGFTTYKTWFKLKSRQICGDCGDWELTDDEYEKAQKNWFKRPIDKTDVKRNPNYQQHLMG